MKTSNAEALHKVELLSRELAGARAQQAATAEVLKAISRSGFDLQTVLEGLTRSAAELCNADEAIIFLRAGDEYHAHATHGVNPDILSFLKANPRRKGQISIVPRGAESGAVEHIPDKLLDEDHTFPGIAPFSDTRAMLSVPMLREGTVEGVFVVSRHAPGPFSDDRIELLRTFADQAMIAIENARLFAEVQARNSDLAKAQDQQIATSKILGVIASSPGDVRPVLAAIAESAARLCEAFDAVVRLREGDVLVFGAHYGPIPVDPKVWAISRKWTGGRSVVDRATIHVHDLADAADEFPEGWAMAQRFGHRTTLAVPLLRENEAIGTIMVRRTEVKPFSEAQTSLLRSFADQAVIAIENVRLFDEVQTRNREMAEALEQQVATSAILRAISASPTDIQPVLDAVTENAGRLCEAFDTTSFLRRGNALVVAAHDGAIPIDYDELPLARDLVTSRAVMDRVPIHVHDLTLAGDEFPAGRDLALRMGFHTILATPLLREGEAIGALMIRRAEVRPFSDRQINLLKTFADQAVIAIENVRLFEEVQARTADLSEALQQQTATADVLKIISRSAFDLQPVLDALAATATRVCEADKGAIMRRDGEQYLFAANAGFSDELVHYAITSPLRSGPGSATLQAAEEGRTVHLPDVLAEPSYTQAEFQRLGGYRTMLAVPLLRQGDPVGVFILTRSDVKPFAAKQIELVETFADQAVIAMENARLFDEVQTRTAELSEALQQQTATADVLKVISRSAFDLHSVLQTLIDSASKLCRAEKSGFYLLEGDVYRLAADYGSMTQEIKDFEQTHPVRIGRDSFVGRAALEKGVIHVPDVSKDLEYGRPDLFKMGGFAACLSVPLMRGGVAIGVFSMARVDPGPFTQRQIELVQTFADQAVIAIENVRLFDEVRARTAQLDEALQQQTATADVLKVISRSAFDLQTVLDTLLESAARLCRADKGGIVRSLDGAFRYVASHGYSSNFLSYIEEHPPPAGRGSVVGRVVDERRIVQIDDVRDDPDYVMAPASEAGDFRTALGVPLMREDDFIGVFVLTRTEVRPFNASEIELVTTFADQAVIAIENVRLFEEVQSRTAELTKSLEDLRTAQGRLVQTEKLASLGQLTAGIAHEIKNPLNFVNNFSALSGELIDELREALAGAPVDAKLRSEVAELTEMLKGNLEKVVQHGRRADSIVKNMLLHSRAGSGEHRPSDINAIVEESLNLAYHGARAEKQGFNITMEKSLDPAAGEIDLFPQEITRVLLNLISNGFYAATKRKTGSDGGYEPTLTAATRNLGDSVEIRIRDNGVGIPPEVKEKMFNPFFTTKPAGEGTGLGLSLSHDIIVKQHGGTIEVETEPNAFTEFRIVLRRGAASLGKSGRDA